MPGRTLPSRSSSDAPPPVDTNVTLSSMSNFAAAVAESPPPMIPALPSAVVSATASSTALVPLAKLSNSNTPAGPFQITVLAARIFSRKSFIDSGPQSMPSQPSGIPSLSVTILISWSLTKSCPQAQSTGRVISMPLALAFSIRAGARVAPFLSNRDFPIGMSWQIFLKVYAIPPMAITPSDWAIRFSITSSLSEIFAPPTIARRGLWTRAGSRTFLNASNSFCRRNPDTQGILPCMPTMEECAR
mmetsp:Transcript_21550/g.42797  ORF Transcript_21550/g.42797 Transcript_21550/m.42797 type:complete len:245 (-) Transcript_21550:707-1441(-)